MEASVGCLHSAARRHGGAGIGASRPDIRKVSSNLARSSRSASTAFEYMPRTKPSKLGIALHNG